MVDKRYSDFKEQMATKDFRLILVGGDFPKVKAKPCISQMKYALEFLGGSIKRLYHRYSRKTWRYY
jgi:hypothetical protein